MRAVQLQHTLARLRGCFALGSGTAVLKEAVMARGIAVGTARAPAEALSEAAKDTIRRVVDEVATVEAALDQRHVARHRIPTAPLPPRSQQS